MVLLLLEKSEGVLEYFPDLIQLDVRVIETDWRGLDVHRPLPVGESLPGMLVALGKPQLTQAKSCRLAGRTAEL